MPGQYKIIGGDTLTSIAKRKGSTVDELLKLNPQVTNRDLIYAGRDLNVPGQAPAPVAPPATTTPPPATTTPPPATPPPPATNRPVYDNTPNQSPFQKATSELVTRPTAPSQEQIRQQELERARQMVEATKGVFLADIARLQEQGLARSSQTSSMAVGAGLAGSPFQQAQEQKTTDFNTQIEQARRAERAAEIQRIFSKGNDDAEKKFQTRRKEFESDREAYLGLLKDKQDNARNTISRMAKTGTPIEDMDEEEYKKLLEAGGLSDLDARALYDENAPAPQTSYQVSGNRIITISKDPITGKVTSKSEAIEGAEGKEGTYTTKISGSNILLIPEVVNSADDIIVKPIGAGKTQKVGKDLYQFNQKTQQWDLVASPTGGGGGGTGEDQNTSDMRSQLQTVIGSDGYISPEDWRIGRVAWIKKGLNPATFDKKFKGFKNPKNKNYELGGTSSSASGSTKNTKKSTSNFLTQEPAKKPFWRRILGI